MCFEKIINNLWAGTGEHGVGMGKREYLYEELGEGTVELMKTIKKTIDPLNLFNPGKVRVPLLFLPCPCSYKWQLYPDTPGSDV